MQGKDRRNSQSNDSEVLSNNCATTIRETNPTEATGWMTLKDLSLKKKNRTVRFLSVPDLIEGSL